MGHDRMFSALSMYVAKHHNAEIENDLQSGTMTITFKSHVPSEGRVVALKVHGTRNVEITPLAQVDWRNFRRIAHIYSEALALIDCFQLIEVEPVTPDESEPGHGRALHLARPVLR